MPRNPIIQPAYLETYAPFRGHATFGSLIGAIEDTAPRIEGAPATCDLMAGTGLVATELRKHFGSQIGAITCIDVNSEMIAALPAEFRKIHANVCNMRADVLDSEFGFVVCRGGLNNLDREVYGDALSEVGRILSPDGFFVVQDHFPKTEPTAHDLNRFEQMIARIEGRTDVPYAPTSADFCTLLKAANFSVVAQDHFAVALPIRARFIAKGFSGQRLEAAMQEAKNFLVEAHSLKRSYEGDEITLNMPVVTITAVNKKP